MGAHIDPDEFLVKTRNEKEKPAVNYTNFEGEFGRFSQAVGKPTSLGASLSIFPSECSTVCISTGAPKTAPCKQHPSDDGTKPYVKLLHSDDCHGLSYPPSDVDSMRRSNVLFIGAKSETGILDTRTGSVNSSAQSFHLVGHGMFPSEHNNAVANLPKNPLKTQRKNEVTRLWECPYCAKSFKSGSDFQKHLRIHTGEKPFMCTFENCGKSFTTSNILRVHLRSHTGERPHECSLCGKRFISSTNLKSHFRSHTGEKPYICSVADCRKRFSEYSSLFKHHIVHENKGKYNCNVCSSSFRRESLLQTHMKKVHTGLGDVSQAKMTEISPTTSATSACEMCVSAMGNLPHPSYGSQFMPQDDCSTCDSMGDLKPVGGCRFDTCQLGEDCFKKPLDEYDFSSKAASTSYGGAYCELFDAQTPLTKEKQQHLVHGVGAVIHDHVHDSKENEAFPLLTK